MANAVVTLKVMPTSPEVNMEELEVKVKEKIAVFAGEGDTKIEEVPIAFGLKALNIIFVMDESKGSPDPLAEKIQNLDAVNSAEITDVRSAIG